ncbi:hypothetical protein TNCV_1872141 [Trichonephila clavipes]|nr:hypothetical protein TNCV_1872141 [Trichonephila clavipes]
MEDVYVTWLTWLDDWEMHRDEKLPLRVVSPHPWKLALDKHVKRSHQKDLAHGLPSDVTLLEHMLQSINKMSGYTVQETVTSISQQELIHVTLQSINCGRSAARDILTQQHVSPIPFRPRQRVSPWWPICPYRTVHCQHSGEWQRSRSVLPHVEPLESPHDPQR